jgi:PKHD-type hydroxylase
MAVPNFARYEVGMKYGPHTDVAFLPLSSQPLRSDVSCTMFISDPSEYQGGELAIGLGTEMVRIKGKTGSAILYPSTTIHEVVPVSSGARLVMITFIESQIPDQLQRDLLYSLGEVRALEGLKIDWRNRVQLEYVIANLHRMWAR